MLLFVLAFGSRGRFFCFFFKRFLFRGVGGPGRGEAREATPLSVVSIVPGRSYLLGWSCHILNLGSFFCVLSLHRVFARFKIIGGQITVGPLSGVGDDSSYVSVFWSL